MKKLIFLALLIAMPFLMYAHAPKKLMANYDTKTDILTLDINHSVKDVKDHYIDVVTISIGEEVIKEVTYSEQSSEATLHAEINGLKLEKGKSYDIKAKCNKMGAKTITLTITE